MISIFKSNKEESKGNNIVLDKENIPKHIAIIMDGNGRWAKERNLPRTFGHKAGVETIRKILKECDKIGVRYLTLYAFSTENWKRPKDEVSALMKLLVEYLRKELEELNKNNVVVRSIGDISKLPKICQDELMASYKKTKNNTGVVLNLALNYGGRDEIIYGIKKAYEKIQKGEISIDDIDDTTFGNFLYTEGIPDPDLIIRPSGEQRLSNFLLWQCAYSEFWYSTINWPDFKEEDLHKAIYDYQHRNRRFGGIK
ncbi:isoprenyl transferase [Clostridium fallax]|uniref:Isoprenyl transferase n=1 Tax=Clostridium fallax TaxID=1533 RepID=A0A1M4V297_9CLOT|nr:isoprenyl transferase [Clostridium fallax]SHE63106.1 Undecaprenyl pyrophosphate synthetase [Clostridium fallax]SQB06583.1 undecaprenyl pyrophosphate synthase [Clostridium fallax]